MITLFNPEAGAVIHDVNFGGQVFFTQSEGEEFKPGDIVQMDDAPAQFILDTFQFTLSVSDDEAADILKAKDEKGFACDQCEKVFDAENKLRMHKMSHDRKKKNAAGVPIAEGKKALKKGEVAQDDTVTQTKIDAEGAKDGLVGEGLTEDNV